MVDRSEFVRVVALIGVVLSAALSPALARADDAEERPVAAPSSAPPPAPKDIVRLANGGVLRGTIIESRRGYPVTIQLVTGEVRTIPWAETTYTGPDEPGRAVLVEEAAPEPVARPEKRLRSRAALTAGILAAVASQITLGAAFYAWFDENVCESRLRMRADSRGALPSDAGLDPNDCSNTGLVVGGLVGTALLLGAGVPLIVYGAKRIPAHKDAAVRFVPWTRGTSGAGGALQVSF